MNMKYFFVVAFLGFCVIQSTQALPQKNEKSIIDDMIQEVKKALDYLSKLISSAVENATQALQDMLKKVKEEAQPIIDEVKDKVGGIIKEMEDKIAAAVAEAQQVGVDVTDCVKGEEDGFKNILNNIVQNELTCVTGEISKAEDLINEGLATVDGLLKDVQNLPNKIENCTAQEGFAAIRCLSTLLADVIKMEKDLPAKITSIVTEATQFVAGLQTRLEVCAATQVAKAGVEVAQLGGNIIDCIQEKIQNH